MRALLRSRSRWGWFGLYYGTCRTHSSLWDSKRWNANVTHTLFPEKRNQSSTSVVLGIIQSRTELTAYFQRQTGSVTNSAVVMDLIQCRTELTIYLSSR